MLRFLLNVVVIILFFCFIELTHSACYAPIIQNKTDVWSVYDQKMMFSATQRCRKLYGDSFCLKYFVKVGERTYRAICSEVHHD